MPCCPNFHKQTFAFLVQQNRGTLSAFPFLRSRSKRKFSKGRTMKFVAAYLLAVLGGNASPTAGDLNKILAAVGAEADDDRIELLLSQVKDKDITELIAAGREKLATVPSGGGAVAVGATPARGAGATVGTADEPNEKEEKVEEKEESDDDEPLFSLFD